jgi:CHAT domain-containing protein/tetratricopeptide (TPR) repeat protein
MAGDATLTFGRGSDRWRLAGSSALLAKVAFCAGASALVLLVIPQSVLHSIGFTSKAAGRLVEARVSGGFDRAPFITSRPADPANSGVFASVFGTTIGNVRGTEAPADRHSQAVAQLLAGHARAALPVLRLEAENSNRPEAWSDLAAALHETAMRDQVPELLAESLTASDRALALRPQFPEALFNRAVVIEHLGLREDAREAWERYLTADSTSDWAAEARTRRDALAPEETLIHQLDRQYERAAANPALAIALTRQDRFEARKMALKDVLGRWEIAELRHDERDADRHLRVARQLGAAVTAVQGDRMLERYVAVIDAASVEQRALLASAHSDYLNGQKAYQENRPGDAETLLRHAAAAFEKGGSPMALPARIYAANMAFEQGRRPQAEHELEALLPTASADFPAYRAQVLKELGRYYVARPDFGGAINLMEETASLFDRLGEPQNASVVKRHLALIYEQTGDPGKAWKYRLAALQGLGGRSSLELRQGVASIADAAILRKEWQTALSFLTIELRIANRLQNDLQLATIPLVRAVVRDRLGDEGGAQADIADAKQVIPRTKDPFYRAYLSVAALRASAMLSSTPPAKADALLTEAIDFQSAKSDGLRLPSLFLERARARRKSGNSAGAMADVRSGIAELEKNRKSLPAGEARWGAFHAAEDLFDEGIDLALSQNDSVAAFRFSESAKARALLDSYKRDPVLDYRGLPLGTVVVEYASLPTQLVIFTADRSGVGATTVECGREKLMAEGDALGESIRKSAAVRVHASALYQRLIEPIAIQLLSATTVVFVSDEATSMVPFSALTDAHGQYLIEKHPIVMAASAAAFAAATERSGDLTAPRSALVLSASEPGAGIGALTYVGTEGRRVKGAYRTATLLADDDVEFDALFQRAPEVDVIHFGGHAVGDDRGIEPASIVLRDKGHERRVGVVEIAKLHLRPASIVVLAGCSTARGERRAAEGVISVAHGFLSAGASSVVATLWPIDDQAASVFFPRLHEKLAAGFSAAEALRQTQLESIRRGDVPASLWAAVQNIGS